MMTSSAPGRKAMSLAHRPVFSLAERAGNRLTLRSGEGHVAHVFVLEDDIVRVTVLPGGAVRCPRTWAIAPGEEDVATEGRDRLDLTGFTLPDFRLEESPDTLTVTTARLRLTVSLTGPYCRWDVMVRGEWRAAAADRPTQS